MPGCVCHTGERLAALELSHALVDADGSLATSIEQTTPEARTALIGRDERTHSCVGGRW